MMGRHELPRLPRMLPVLGSGVGCGTEEMNFTRSHVLEELAV